MQQFKRSGAFDETAYGQNLKLKKCCNSPQNIEISELTGKI